MQNDEWFFLLFSFTEGNQNSCGKSTNIFMMWAVDHERKI